MIPRLFASRLQTLRTTGPKLMVWDGERFSKMKSANLTLCEIEGKKEGQFYLKRLDRRLTNQLRIRTCTRKKNLYKRKETTGKKKEASLS